MENSCRKKYKPSPKKWILASRYSEFRRNPALIPANAGLFHYAGNNPVRYIDPDGKRDMTAFEKKFATEILGKYAPLDTKIYSNIANIGSFSSPTGFIIISKDYYSDSFSDSRTLSNMMHELFHQVQYNENPFSLHEFSAYLEIQVGLSSSNNKIILHASVEAEAQLKFDLGAFSSLAGEFFVDGYMKIKSDGKIRNYVYRYGDIGQYNILSDFPYLESQASMVEQFSKLYYLSRHKGLNLDESQIQQMKKMAQILENSGIKSEATRWILENY